MSRTNSTPESVSLPNPAQTPSGSAGPSGTVVHPTDAPSKENHSNNYSIASKLFSFFTADIIKEKVIFFR